MLFIYSPAASSSIAVCLINSPASSSIAVCIINTLVTSFRRKQTEIKKKLEKPFGRKSFPLKNREHV